MIKPVLIIFLNLAFFTTAFSQNDEKANVPAVKRNQRMLLPSVMWWRSIQFFQMM